MTDSEVEDPATEEAQIHELICSEHVQGAVRTIERLNLLNISAVAQAQNLTEEETQMWIDEYQRWHDDMLLGSLTSGINIDGGVLCEKLKKRNED